MHAHAHIAHLPATPPPRATGRKRASYVIDGAGTTWVGNIYKAAMMPIKLRTLCIDMGISTGDLADAVVNTKGNTLSRSTISLTLGKGYIPAATTPDFKQQVEAFLAARGVADDVLAGIWDREKTAKILPLGTHPNRQKTNPEDELTQEAEMLTPTAMKAFKLFRNPFIDDIREAADVYMSESHRYAEAAMLDAARSGGFVAISGPCGAGKSVLRKRMLSNLNEHADVRVIFPQTIDKGLLTSSLILEAIIRDLAPEETVRVNNEARARQVRRLLIESSHAGMRHVLVIEEAHDLSVPCMKQLKRLWEIEDGYLKVLGIVLIGQEELQMRLNSQNHPEMREVILRCLLSRLLPLDADLEPYVRLKFQRVGSGVDACFAEGWVEAIRRRLTVRNGQGEWSIVYPLHVNNLLAKAMNMAAELGETQVTPEYISKA